MRVLLVEDDDTIAEPLADGLRRYGFTVERSATGAAALGRPPGDIVLLDLGLPDMDGIDVCRRIRQVSEVPIIMLTARGTEADRVVGLELGADDYLAKPFSTRELIARMRAVVRRFHVVPEHAAPARAVPAHVAPANTVPARAVPGHPAEAPPQYVGVLSIDRRTRQVRVAGESVDLTPKEFDLLCLLAQDPGAVYEREYLLETVWTERFYGPTRTLDVHVAALRRKLGGPDWIETIRGVGFRLRPPGR
ncbi:response regulator transcription factor [Streptomyces sp. NPDC001530]|uniref:response regulator transcription factor n=1 Tax=Streptomyces sp. NPDC001530 TaxID=3364582 RepID=UPI0036D0AC76